MAKKSSDIGYIESERAKKSSDIGYRKSEIAEKRWKLAII